MSVGGQSNAPQTPFSPNYRERRSVQPRGPGNAYTQRPGQQPNPQQPAQLQPAPQPNQPPQYDGGFGGGFGQPQQPPFGGGSQSPMLQAQGPNTFGNAYAQRFHNPFVKDIPQTSPDPNQPPPGMELNPDYTLPPDTFTTANTPRGRFRPIQQPEPQTGGGREYTPPPQFSSGQIAPSFDSGYGNSFGGGFGGGYSSPFGGGFGGGYSTPFSDYGGGFGGGYGGGYSSPYMSPSMMGGLASLFGGMQGGGFQGMFNQQPQQQSYGSIQGNMRNPAYQQQMAFQQGNSEEATRNRIQSQLNEQFNRDKASGMSLMDMAKAQDELLSRLHSQYGLKQILAEPT